MSLRRLHIVDMMPVETLRVIHLDPHRNIIAVENYAGCESHVEVPMRAIIADALRLRTAALILSHNHPSGDPTSSRSDIEATRLLARTTRAIGVTVHDHIIEAGGRATSFRSLGLV